MTASRAASVGQAFQSWATTLGIIIAGVWAVYTFIYKEIIIPETSPINESVNMSIQDAGTASDNTTGPDVSAVEVALTSTQPRDRTVVRRCLWYFWSTYHEPEDPISFIDAVRADISTSGGYYAEKYAKASTAELLAGGQPPKISLRPEKPRVVASLSISLVKRTIKWKFRFISLQSVHSKDEKN
jgi:hypothetical protein